MSVDRTGPERTSRVRVDRRHLIAGGAALVVGAAAGGLPGSRLASADGLPSATLRLLASYDDWRRSWDLIVPLTRGTAWPRLVLLYDRAGGYGSVQTIDQSGGVRELRGYSDWRSTWSQIVRSEFTGDPNRVGLVLYDRQGGQASVQTVGLDGTMRDLRTHPGWRRSWDRMVPVGPNQILLYDRAARQGTFLRLDAGGNLTEQRTYDGWRDSWDIIVSGKLRNTFDLSNDVVFYDREPGEASISNVAPDGTITLTLDADDWRTTWDSIASGELHFGPSLDASANLVLLSRGDGVTDFLRMGGDGRTSLVHRDAGITAGDWSTVTPIGTDLVLFYNRDLGRAELRTTGAVEIQPPVLPTPPIVPTVTPEGNSVRLVLAQGDRDKAWDTYTLKSPDPAGANGASRVTSVKNTTDTRISLIHWDRNGSRRGPLYVKSGQTLSDFNGMSVAGQWQATVSGSKSNAPARVTLQVGFQ